MESGEEIKNEPQDDMDLIFEDIQSLIRFPKQKYQLDIDRTMNLISETTRIFKMEPSIIELESPWIVVGTLRSDLISLITIFEMHGYPPKTQYLFLGNYINRGQQGIEILTILMYYKCKYPSKFHLLRGQHEWASVTKIHGFYSECKRKWNIK